MNWEISAGFMPNGGMASQTGDERLVVLFRMEPVEMKASTEAGIPQFTEEEFVEIRQPAAKDSLYDGPLTDRHRARFKERYDVWKKNHENPVVGLPLKEWPPLTASKVRELAAVGIKTVEEIAAVADSELPRLGLYANNVRQKARDWLAKGKDDSAMLTLRKENDKFKDDIDYIKKENAYLKEQIRELSAGSKPSESVSSDSINKMVAEAVANALKGTKGKTKE